MTRNTHSSNECWHTYHKPIKITWNPFVSPGHYSGNATGHHCFLQAPDYSEMCMCMCVCVYFISLHHMRSCLFFFNNISSYTRWWSERNVWYENKFYFSFQITLPKDMVISLGSSFWNWSLWYPSSSSLHQVESKDEKIDSKEIKKIYFSSHT